MKLCIDEEQIVVEGIRPKPGVDPVTVAREVMATDEGVLLTLVMIEEMPDGSSRLHLKIDNHGVRIFIALGIMRYFLLEGGKP